MDMEESKDNDCQSIDAPVVEASPETSAPQSNIVLRKGIRKIKQGMKRYNSQLTILRQDVRSCRQKATEQQKLMSEQQKQLAEQQKQILEYATRMDENDKKNDEMSRKFSTLLQELNKCKTELQYWRSKSPATPLSCTNCGSAILPNPEELEALANQGVHLEGLEPPLSDFMPIEEEVVVAEVVPECSVVNTSKSNKRKLEEVKETPSRTAPKSARRILKGGRNKRAKI